MRQPVAGRWPSGHVRLDHPSLKNNPLFVLTEKPIAPAIMAAWGDSSTAVEGARPPRACKRRKVA